MYISELDIYSPLDRPVDLTQEYPMDTDVEVYSPMKLTIQYLSLDAEDKIKTEIYFQYFEKISQSLLSTSECVVEVFFLTKHQIIELFFTHILNLQVALTNLQENPKLQPLLPSFSAFLRNLVGFTSENSHVVQRIPRIFNALMKNPHLQIESEVLIYHE